jgi:hypothetical protein
MKKHIVILNFITRKVDSFVIENIIEEDEDIEEYIEETLNYSLSNCQWMVTDEEPKINFLSF